MVLDPTGTIRENILNKQKLNLRYTEGQKVKYQEYWINDIKSHNA